MGTFHDKKKCPDCGGVTVEVRDYCTACRKFVAGAPVEALAEVHHEHFPHMGAAGEGGVAYAKRSVHHEGFPHVVADEPEP